MSEDQKNKVHPIVKKALKMAYKGAEPVEFDDDAIKQLQDMLRKHFGKPDLLKAVLVLINLAGALEDKGYHSASMKLIIVVSIAADALKEMRD